MKQLAGATFDKKPLKVERYHELEDDPTTLSEYDKDGADEKFDRETLEYALNDFFDADPATRYQVAKNYFERQMTDALVSIIFHE